MKETSAFRDLPVRLGLDPACPEPPRVREWPVLGSVVPFLREPQRHLLDAYRELGPVFRMRLGLSDFVIFAGPEGMDFVTHAGKSLITTEGVWQDISRITGADPHAIITNVDGERHAELRSLLRPGMSKAAAIESLEQSLILAEDALGRVARRGAIVDAVDFSRELVFAQLGRSMTGNAPAGMFGAASHVLRAIVHGVRFPILQRLPLGRSLRRSVKEVTEISGDILASRSSWGTTFVRDVKEGLRTSTIAEGDLPGIMLTPFIAGLDTMAHTFAFVLYRLARHPEWAARLRDELDRAIARTGKLDADAIALCPELGFFVNEVMRIHPLSPGVIRMAREDFVVDGLQVRAGSLVILPHTLSHFMSEFFPEPDRFDPMRFHPDRAEHRGAMRFAPFGVGAHVCLGVGIAEMLLRANLAAVLRHAELRGADPAYALRVSNTSGACPVGFTIAIAPRADDARAAA